MVVLAMMVIMVMSFIVMVVILDGLFRSPSRFIIFSVRVLNNTFIFIIIIIIAGTLSSN